MSALDVFSGFAIYAVIVLALGAGIVAAFGRERHAKRRPDRQWWVNRLLVTPLLAIAATAAAETFDLSSSMAAFTAAMLSLGGYDILCLLERKWRSRVAGAVSDQS